MAHMRQAQGCSGAEKSRGAIGAPFACWTRPAAACEVQVRLERRLISSNNSAMFHNSRLLEIASG